MGEELFNRSWRRYVGQLEWSIYQRIYVSLRRISPGQLKILPAPPTHPAQWNLFIPFHRDEIFVASISSGFNPPAPLCPVEFTCDSGAYYSGVALEDSIVPVV